MRPDKGGGRTLPILAGLVLCLAGACVADSSGEVSFVRLANIPTVSVSGADEAQASYRLIRSRESWESAWQQLYRGRRPRPALPDVDFDRQMILLASLGRRPSGGYTVTVQDIHLAGNTLAVSVLIREPGKGCIVTTGITVPVDIVVLPASESELKIAETVSPHECNDDDGDNAVMSHK